MSKNKKDNYTQKNTYIKQEGKSISIDAQVRELWKHEETGKSPPKIHNLTTKNPTYVAIDEIPEKDYKNLIFKMFNEVKEELRNWELI